MKPYLIAKNKIKKLISQKPITQDFNDESWVIFANAVIQNDPNKATTIIRNNCSAFLIFLDSKYDYTKNLGEKIFVFTSKSIRDTCIQCGNKTLFKGLTTGYARYCSKACTGKDEKIKAKIRNTCLERFGSTSPFSSLVCRAKMEETNMLKYGTKNVFAAPEIKQRIQKTSLVRYGTKNPGQSKHAKVKNKDTCQLRYGVDHITQTEIFKEQSKLTSLQKYGVEYPMQHPDIQFKSAKNSKRLKDLILPSGKIAKYQGYENVAILHLLKYYPEDELAFFKDVPIFKYGESNKVYFPDLFVRATNTIVEVKSTWTLSLPEQHEEILKKSNAVISAGFNFKLFICTKTDILEEFNGATDGRKKEKN